MQPPVWRIYYIPHIRPPGTLYNPTNSPCKSGLYMQMFERIELMFGNYICVPSRVADPDNGVLVGSVLKISNHYQNDFFSPYL